MTRRHNPAWVWMIGAFDGALAVAVLADLPLSLGDGDGS